MRFKKLLCLITAVVICLLSVYSASAFTMQHSHICQTADSSGAYVITWNGKHAEISRYASANFIASLDLNYEVSAVCSHHGRTVFFCDDSENNQLFVYVYYFDTDVLESFAVYDAKMYSGIDFGCDDNAIYIENHRNRKELMAYSYQGALRNRYLFDHEITAVFSGYHTGFFAVSDDVLYLIKGGSFSAVTGGTIDAPAFSADDHVIASVSGRVYVHNGSCIKRSFPVDADQRAASACVIGDTLYYPCGSVINGYDINSGEKICFYRTGFTPVLLYADDDCVSAVGSDSSVLIEHDAFVSLIEPEEENRSENNDSDSKPGSVSSESSSSKSKTKTNADDGNQSNADNNHKRTEHSVDERSDQASVSEISSDVYTVNFANYTITGISPATTLARFKSNIRHTGYSVAFYRDGQLKKSGNICTAMKAVFTSDSADCTFELSVIGDITGEGNCNSRDLNLLMDYLIGSADFNGVYTAAADLYPDGKVDVRDLATLKRTIS